MTERMRELALVGGLVGAILIGALIEATGSPVRAPEPEPVAGGFVQRAVFCPPALRGDTSSMRLAIASGNGSAAPIGVEPGAKGNLDLAENTFLAFSDSAAQAVTGYGALPAAGASTKVDEPVAGGGAAPCSAVASSDWYFAEGTSLLGFDERLLISNPFPEEAVVRIVLHTEKGERALAGLSDVPVPAGESVEIRLNRYIKVQPLLGAHIETVRGRVIAWRELLVSARGRPAGVQFALGAPSPSETWYLPDGIVGEGYEEKLVLLNPTSRQAIVTVTLATDERLLQPPELAELKVQPGTARRLPLDELRLSGPRPVSAIVNSTNGVPLVVERTIWYSTGEVTGVTSETAVPRPAARWILSPPLPTPDLDALILMNAGNNQDVRVDVSLLGEKGPARRPKDLQGIRIEPGLRRRIPIDSWTGDGSYVAVVSSTDRVVAERFSYSSRNGDPAATMGVPIRPIGE